MLRDLSVIVWKELTQVANRRRFHMEKALFAAAASVALAVVALRQTALDPVSANAAAAFGRAAFFFMAIAAAAVLSPLALVSASGIILSERIGLRLDLLRITPVDIATVVRGKGLSILASSLLVVLVLMPVAAATLLFGGVSYGDFLTAIALIAVYIFFAMSIGLFISAGSTGTLDRAVKLFEVACLLGFFGWWLAVRLAGRGGLPGYLAALSPPLVWVKVIESRATWRLVAVNVFFYGAVGMLLSAVGAGWSLRRTLRDAEPSEAPKTRDLIDAVKRSAYETSTAGKREDEALHSEIQPICASGAGSSTRRARRAQIVNRMRRPIASLFSRLLPGPNSSGYFGELVATEMKRLPVVLILAPLASLVPITVFFILDVIVEHGWMIGTTVELHLQAGSALMAGVLIVAVALSGCASVAGERRRRTIGLLHVTRCGGPEMLFWKGGAIFAGQAAAIAICAGLTAAAGLARNASFVAIMTDEAALVTSLLFAFAAGVSFSLLARTPLHAAALLGVSVLALAPVCRMVLYAFSTHGFLPVGSPAKVEPTVLYICAVGAAGVLFRNLSVKASPIALTVCLALLVAGAGAMAGDLLFSGYKEQGMLLQDVYYFYFTWRGGWAQALASSILMFFSAVLLIAGTRVNWNRMLSVQPTSRRG